MLIHSSTLKLISAVNMFEKSLERSMERVYCALFGSNLIIGLTRELILFTEISGNAKVGFYPLPSFVKISVKKISNSASTLKLM